MLSTTVSCPPPTGGKVVVILVTASRCLAQTGLDIRVGKAGHGGGVEEVLLSLPPQTEGPQQVLLVPRSVGSPD